MENKLKSSKEKLIYLDDVILNKKDLLRALSWFDFITKDELSEEDKFTKDNLLKVVNYLTRHA